MTQTAQRLLADIRNLAPHITSRAAEIEAGRRIPFDLVEALRSIGVFRMFVPQSHGGLELDLPAALEVIGALGRIDGSLGWTAMVGAGSAIFVPDLPRETFDQVYQNGPDIIIAASAQPAGTAEAVADGCRIKRTVAIHERLPARRLDPRVLRRDRACFAAGGGSALYENSPLQRRMRDLHAAAQHVGVHQRHYVNSGELLLDSSAVNSKINVGSLAGSRGEG
jgi:alkylation response protein AidB-like acyl-CoA dehydrogenase